MQAVPEPASVLFQIYWWEMIHELERDICDSTPGGNAGDDTPLEISYIQEDQLNSSIKDFHSA